MIFELRGKGCSDIYSLVLIGIKCFDVEAASILRWDEGYCIPPVWEELHRAYAKGERNLTEAIDRIWHRHGVVSYERWLVHKQSMGEGELMEGGLNYIDKITIPSRESGGDDRRSSRTNRFGETNIWVVWRGWVGRPAVGYGWLL